jgi:predicted house-cleaning noncanonical NTP pyrophosphatase (MazG superfamily)
MKKHNKLVRDKIPAICQANGDTPHFRVIDDEEYLKALLDKDDEESQELRENPSLEELADKLEVLYAIANLLGHSPAEVENARVKKAKERGGFAKRIFLESTD